MRSLRKCPSCRALLTEEQLANTGGACPYCDQKLPKGGDAGSSPDSELDNPYAAPKTALGQDVGQQYESPTVPRDLGGKIALAGVLLSEQLLLFAALVLTVWIPGNLLLEMAKAAGPNPPDLMAMMGMTALVEQFFTPIYTAGIITALAARMGGERISYSEAMRAGLHHWGRLFGARLVAGLLITLGILCFIVPGILLGIRFMMIDEAVVLEGAGVTVSRWRSTMLTRGRQWALFLAGTFSISLIVLTGLSIGGILEYAGLQDHPLATAAGQCLVYVVSSFSICLVFLFYWEARHAEERRQHDFPDEEPPDIMQRHEDDSTPHE